VVNPGSRRGLVVAVLAATTGTLVAIGCGETVLVLSDPPDSGGDGSPFGFPPQGTGDSGGCSDTPSETAPPCPTDGGVDANGGSADASCEALCPAAGGACVDGGCQIACTQCSGTVCPPGLPCTVNCGGPGSCSDIDCGRASSCDVVCKGAGGSNCAGVRCLSPSCLVHCEGNDACTGAVELGGKTAKLECVGANACLAAVTCCAGSCNFMCPGAMNCTAGLCCAAPGPACKSDKPATTCTGVACSGL
jgi:hypothetical protein